MLLSTRIKLALALWFVGEALVFVLVAKLIGYPLTFLFGVATTFAGVALLKRAGASAMLKVRAALDGRRLEGPPGGVLDDTLAALGALALLLPGFLSDIIGIALAVPALRDRVGGWLERRGFAPARSGANRRRRGPATIDLAPEEWQPSDPRSRPMTKV